MSMAYFFFPYLDVVRGPIPHADAKDCDEVDRGNKVVRVQEADMDRCQHGIDQLGANTDYFSRVINQKGVLKDSYQPA